MKDWFANFLPIVKRCYTCFDNFVGVTTEHLFPLFPDFTFGEYLYLQMFKCIVSTVFGVDLTTLVMVYNSKRPAVVDACITEVENRGR